MLKKQEYKPIFTHIRERDVDLLLIEEFKSNPVFAAWFLEKVTNARVQYSQLECYHSVSDAQHGETDLQLIVKLLDGEILAVLIENKIDAPVQPRQPERYKVRGEAGLARGDWTKYFTCLAAPWRYIEEKNLATSFNSVISYEELSQSFLSVIRDSLRAKHKSEVLSEAIERAKRGWTPVADKTVTNFWMDYWHLSQKYAPELQMTEPASKPGRSKWIRFKPKGLWATCTIVHKTDLGRLDLYTKNPSKELRQQFAELAEALDKYCQIVSDTSSVTLRMSVPKVFPLLPVADQVIQIESCLNAAKLIFSRSQELKSRF